MEEEFSEACSVMSDYSIISESQVHSIFEVKNTGTGTKSVELPESFIKSISEDMTASACLSEVPVFTAKDSCINKVHFGTIQKVNNEPDGDLAVVFGCEKDFHFNSSDRICLYKMGFKSTKDFLCFVWASKSKGNLTSLCSADNSIIEVPSTVVFKASDLPQENGDEFYQLGYLMYDGKIAGVSVPFEFDKVDKSLLIEVENAARSILALRVNSLLEEKKKLEKTIEEMQEKHQSLQMCFKEEHFEMIATENDSKVEVLEEKILALMEEKERIKSMHEKEREMSLLSVEVKTSEIKKLDFLLVDYKATQTKLISDHEEVKKEMLLAQERNDVLIQDTKDLKEKMEIIYKEKEASQRIASDLSQNNMEMTEKITNLMKVEMKIMDAVTSEGFSCKKSLDNHQVTATQTENITEATEENNMGESFFYISNNEAVETFSVKMESILKELANLKRETQRNLQSVANSENNPDRSTNSESIVHYCMSAECDEADLVTSSKSSMISEESKKSAAEKRSEALEAVAKIKKACDDIKETSPTSVNYQKMSPLTIDVGGQDQIRVECEGEETLKMVTDDKKPNLSQDGHFVLPTSQTAPVFLPPPVEAVVTVQPSAGSQIDPPTMRDFHASSPQQHQPLAIAAANLTTDNASLPTPLKPETTSTAKTAAVLSQFKKEATPPSAPSLATAPESDEEEYMSSSDGVESNENTAQREPIITLSCPMCNMTFLPNAINLLNDHTESHLEKVCPVCSTAFARNVAQHVFEKHVTDHFPEDEIPQQPSNDSSGPWGDSSSYGPGSGFHLLEID